MRNGPLIDRYSGSGLTLLIGLLANSPSPSISPRHVSQETSSSGASTPRSSSSDYDERRIEGENGDRDDIHSPRAARESSKSRFRVIEMWMGRALGRPGHTSMRMFSRVWRRSSNISTMLHDSYRRVIMHMRPTLLRIHIPGHLLGDFGICGLSVDGGSRRAFAVWGHDESDSNASDSDSQP